MTYLTKKIINGKKYTYAIRSVRLPGGKVIKISKLITDNKEMSKEEIEKYLDEKEAELFVRYTERFYERFKLPDKDALIKIEKMRIEYKKILKKLSPNQLKDLFDRFTVNFTYESNALEGNSLTLKDVAIIIYENTAIKGKDLREIYDTRNSREVVDIILKKKFKVNEKYTLKMHSMLVKDTGVPEGYKQVPNYIQGRQVLTTAPEDVPQAMKKLFSWFKDKKNEYHPLQLAAHFHGRFENTHPFEDGNGRVGRFLVNIILVNAGYPPLIIRKTQRISYFNALEDSDNNRKTTLERFLYERLKETHEKFFKVYLKYLKLS